MDDSTLRLVVELYEEKPGETKVAVRRCDRPVSYGPVATHDLHYLIEALLPTRDPFGEPTP